VPVLAPVGDSRVHDEPLPVAEEHDLMQTCFRGGFKQAAFVGATPAPSRVLGWEREGTVAPTGRG
jgi:hypothetical protein